MAMVAIPRKVGSRDSDQIFYPAISGPPSLAEVQDAVNKANAKLSRGDVFYRVETDTPTEVQLQARSTRIAQLIADERDKQQDTRGSYVMAAKLLAVATNMPPFWLLALNIVPQGTGPYFAVAMVALSLGTVGVWAATERRTNRAISANFAHVASFVNTAGALGISWLAALM